MKEKSESKAKIKGNFKSNGKNSEHQEIISEPKNRIKAMEMSSSSFNKDEEEDTIEVVLCPKILISSWLALALKLFWHYHTYYLFISIPRMVQPELS